MDAMSVLGPVPAADLGTTAIHEHLFIDTSSYWIRQFGRPKPEAVLGDERLAVTELAHFTAAGGHTLVDITPIGIGRNPEACRRVAQATGLNIVVATGYYTHFFHPTELYEQTIDQIAAGMLAEIRDGIGTTGIRPGILKVATFLEIAPTEEKALRAAARTQHASGYPIYYITRTLFARKRATKDSAKPSRIITVEDAPEALPVAASRVLRTSPQSRQAFHQLTEPVSSARAEKLAKLIARVLGAGKTGVNANKVLGLVGGLNTKKKCGAPFRVYVESRGPEYSYDTTEIEVLYPQVRNEQMEQACLPPRESSAHERRLLSHDSSDRPTVRRLKVSFYRAQRALYADVF